MLGIKFKHGCQGITGYALFLIALFPNLTESFFTDKID